MEEIHLIITGGTIDSVFDAANDEIVVSETSAIVPYLQKYIRPHISMTQEVVTMKDSRSITDNIRAEILSSIEKCTNDKIIVTHGTYTMADTACYIAKRIKESNKAVVVTGSMLPLKGFSPTDATFNLGFAIASVLSADPGVYLAMNAKLFEANEAVKNVDAGRFELVTNR